MIPNFAFQVRARQLFCGVSISVRPQRLNGCFQLQDVLIRRELAGFLTQKLDRLVCLCNRSLQPLDGFLDSAKPVLPVFGKLIAPRLPRQFRLRIGQDTPGLSRVAIPLLSANVVR